MLSETPLVIRWVKYMRIPEDQRVSRFPKAMNGSRLICLQRLVQPLRN